MKLFKNPNPKELAKLISKHWQPDSIALHYTGNMFGIGCRLSSNKAINKINQYKQREEKNGFIVLIADIQWLYDNEIEVPLALQPILSQYWPGNLTVVFPVKHPALDALAINGKVAFRVPTDNMLRQIIDYLDEPIISTSVNVSGLPPAESLQEIQKRYEAWFDIGFVPTETKDSEASTIIEYIDTDETGKPVLPYVKCLRESSIPFYEIKQNFMEPTILFMCTGNICRSPIAEYLFNYYSKAQNLPYVAKSAGLLETGALISLNSMQLLAEQGIRSEQHYSRKINPEIMSSSWLVLTMEQRQKDNIIRNFPESAHKVFTLKEYVGSKGDIADPIGYDIDYYRDIYQQIDEAVLKLIDILTQNNKV